jgi:hypothetical protein
MPGTPIVHMGAQVLCMHGGQAMPTVPNPRVRVSGQAVATQAAPYTVSGCTNPPPPGGTGPCVTATWLTASVRVKAGGLPVLLQNSQAVCVPTGTGLTIMMTQQRVTAI